MPRSIHRPRPPTESPVERALRELDDAKARLAKLPFAQVFNSRTFTKLFSSITESTVWCEPHTTRLVWITLLAMADQDGQVWGSVPGLANRARVSVEEADTALLSFLSPDPRSRTKDHEGRRIQEIDGGWKLLNHGKYRDLMNAEDRREYYRMKKQEQRKREASQKAVKECPTLSRPSTHTEAEALKDYGQKFGQFWKAYPRRVKKKRAMQAWTKLNPDDELVQVMLAAIEVQKRSPDWTKDGGTFIPHPTSWLNDRRWEDERAAAPDAARKVAL